MSARRRKQTPRSLAPMLESLVEALEAQKVGERRGAGAALRAFGHVAALEIPHRGTFAPEDSDLYLAIEQIADAHLGFKKPRQAFYAAAMEIEDRELRDRIQSSASHMQTVSDQAYFYAGLAFGVTFARWGSRW